MSADLPIEIWNYISSIRRENFKLLLLKFSETLQYRIAWKQCKYEGLYYKFNDGKIFSIDNLPALYSDYHLEFSAINLKIKRSLGLRSYNGGYLEDVLTFHLLLPTCVEEVSPRYCFKLKSFRILD